MDNVVNCVVFSIVVCLLLLKLCLLINSWIGWIVSSILLISILPSLSVSVSL